MSDETKSSQNGSAKDSTSSCPVVPNRSAKPPFSSNASLSQEEQSQIHSEAVAVMEKARQEQEKRNQLRRLEEEQREKELKERQEREERERRRREEEEKGHQEKKRLERQKAEEEEDKENREGEERARKGKEHSSDTPTKSVSLDSPVPNHIVSEIKVSLWFPQPPSSSSTSSPRNAKSCSPENPAGGSRSINHFHISQREPLTRARSEEMGRSVPGLPDGWMKVALVMASLM